MALPRTYSTFAGADGTDFVAGNSSFSYTKGTFTMSSGHPYPSTSSSENLAIVSAETFTAEQFSECVIDQTSSRRKGVFCLGDGSGNGYAFYGQGTSYGTTQLIKEVVGSPTQLGSTSTYFHAGDTVRLECSASTPSQTCKLNGTTTISGTDATFSSGKAGISGRDNSAFAQIRTLLVGNLGSSGQSFTGVFIPTMETVNLNTVARGTVALPGSNSNTDAKVNAGAVAVGASPLAGINSKSDEILYQAAISANVVQRLSGIPSVGAWTQLSPSVTLLSPGTGTRAARGYGTMAYDPVRRRVYNHVGYIDGAGRRDSIYSNSIEYLDFAANAIIQEKLSNWNNNNADLTFTFQLSGDETDPTPHNRHPYFCYLNGKLWHFSGLNSNVHADKAFVPSAVNTSTFIITLASTTPYTNGDEVNVTSTGTMPTGLTSGASVYLIRLGATTFALATSYSNAMAGTKISITGQGTGTHTLTRVTGNHASDIWAYDIPSTTWTEFHPNPSYSGYQIALTAALSANPNSNKILITNLVDYAGSTGSQASFIYDVSAGTLTKLSAHTGDNTSPTVQSANCMCYDSKRNKTWMFGAGSYLSGGQELWAFDWPGQTWSTVAQAATKPGARLYHVVVYNSKYDCLIVYGGAAGDAGSFYSDLWVGHNLDGIVTWKQIITATTPNTTKLTYGAYDPDRNQLIIYNMSNEYWVFQYSTASINSNSPDEKSNIGATAFGASPISGLLTRSDEKNYLATTSLQSVNLSGANSFSDSRVLQGNLIASFSLTGSFIFADSRILQGLFNLGAFNLNGAYSPTDGRVLLGNVTGSTIVISGAFFKSDELKFQASTAFATSLFGAGVLTDEALKLATMAIGAVNLGGLYTLPDSSVNAGTISQLVAMVGASIGTDEKLLAGVMLNAGKNLSGGTVSPDEKAFTHILTVGTMAIVGQFSKTDESIKLSIFANGVLLNQRVRNRGYYSNIVLKKGLYNVS